jgi:hypothetical protein
MTAKDKVTKTALKELKKAIPLLRILAANPKFTKKLAKEGFRIDLHAVEDMEKLLRKTEAVGIPLLTYLR